MGRTLNTVRPFFSNNHIAFFIRFGAIKVDYG